MNTKTIIAAVVGAIASFLLGWIIWGILLMDYFQANMIHYDGLMINPPILWAIFLSGLAQTTLFAFLFEKMNVVNLMDGFKYGVIINFFISISMTLFFYSSMNWYIGVTVMVVDILVNTIYGGLIGDISESATLKLNDEKVSLLSQAEQIVLGFSGKSIVLRSAGLVGPNRHPGLFFRHKNLLTAPNSYVNLVHQKDIVALIIASIKDPNIHGILIFNS